jgi:hypothetical protein
LNKLARFPRTPRPSPYSLAKGPYPARVIAILYQNDDFGKDYLIGLRDGLGDKAGKMIVATHLRDKRCDDRFRRLCR